MVFLGVLICPYCNSRLRQGMALRIARVISITRIFPSNYDTMKILFSTTFLYFGTGRIYEESCDRDDRETNERVLLLTPPPESPKRSLK